MSYLGTVIHSLIAYLGVKKSITAESHNPTTQSEAPVVISDRFVGARKMMLHNAQRLLSNEDEIFIS